MSVSQKRQAPEVPDYEAREIVEWLRQEYGFTSEEEWVEEFGLKPTGIFHEAQQLEKDDTDTERRKREMGIDAMLEHEYKSFYEEVEEDGAGSVHVGIYDPDNDEAYLAVLKAED